MENTVSQFKNVLEKIILSKYKFIKKVVVARSTVHTEFVGVRYFIDSSVFESMEEVKNVSKETHMLFRMIGFERGTLIDLKYSFYNE